MRCLAVSRDLRFLTELRQAAPDTVRFVEAHDAAAALRVVHERAIDCAVVDATADPQEAGEFLAWWAAAPERTALPLFVAGTPAGSAPAGAIVLLRDPAAVAGALQARGAPWLDPNRQVLHGPQGEAPLTPSETALLISLVRAGRPLPARDLAQAALGYADAASAASVRTHLGNLRRKAAAVGLPRLVGTRARRGYYAENLSIRAD